MHGIQAWVGLPTELEEIEPAFAHHGPEDLPTYELADGLWARLIAGEAFGAKAAVKTHSPMFYVHWRLRAGARAQLAAEYPSGPPSSPAARSRSTGGRSSPARCWCSRPASRYCSPPSTDAEIMLLGGEPIGERFIEWNFVSSSRERIEQAKADWRAGRMKLPDLDHDEFIPLPAQP